MSEGKEKILLVQNSRQVKDTKWSFRRYLTEIWHYKWWVAGASIMIAVAGAFGLEFVYNRSKRIVSGSFNLDIPSVKVVDGENGNPTFVLYGGESLSASDIFSLNAINSVINENEGLKTLNPDTISKSISFSVLSTNKSGMSSPSASCSFSISVRSSSFRSLDQAKTFVVKLAERPLAIGREAVSSFSAVSAIYSGFEVLDYSEQAALIVEKANAVKASYEALLSDFSGSHLLADGKTTLSSEFERFHYAHTSGSSMDADVMVGEVSSNHYLKFTNTAEGRASKIAELKNLGASTLENAKKTIAGLSALKESYDRLASTTQIVTSETEYTETMVKLNDQISAQQSALNDYLSSLKTIGYVSGSSKDLLEVSSISDINSVRLAGDLSESDGYIQHLESPESGGWAAACASFGGKIKALKTSYDADITTLNDSFRYLQSHYAGSVRFSIPSIISESGGFNLFFGVIGGFVLGFAASSLICTFVGIWKEDKREKAEAKQ